MLKSCSSLKYFIKSVNSPFMKMVANKIGVDRKLLYTNNFKLDTPFFLNSQKLPNLLN